MELTIGDKHILASNPGIWTVLLNKDSRQITPGTQTRHSRDAKTWIITFPFQVSLWCNILPRFGYRTRLWKERLERVRLWLRRGPVYVEFSSFCCDTGYFSWATEFENGREAWRGTRWDALGGGDGPTYFNVITAQEDVDHYFPPPCDHEYSVSMTNCGAYVCWKCGDHMDLVRCFCGWAADGGDGARQLVAMGETL